MGKLRVVNSLSLDGVMQAPALPDEDERDGFAHGGWAVAYNDEVMGQVMGEHMAASSGALLLGRRTYEGLYAFWPNQTDDNPFTDVLNRTQKYVASRTLQEPLPWENSTLLGADVPAAVAELKRRLDGNIVILGSGALIRSLLPHGLIDEFVLPIHPLVLGSGTHLFAGDGPYAKLELVHSEPTTTGVLITVYRAVRS
jgi:dihydrofolate reductase